MPRQNAQASARGYHRERFEDAWARYPPVNPSTRQNTNEDGGETAKTNRQYGKTSDGLKTQVGPMNTGLTDGLTVQDANRPEDADDGDDIARF